jgi:hypothetical protein
LANYSTTQYSAVAVFTPAATSHAGNDCFGAAQEFVLKDRLGGAPATGSHIKITSLTFMQATGTNVTTVWRLHLYNVTPPSAIADDAAFDVPSGDRASYLGYVDISQLVDTGATLYIDMPNLNKQIKLLGTSVFGYLVNVTTLTAEAVAHTITLQCQAV